MTTNLKTTLRPYDSGNGRYFDFTEFETLGYEFISAFALGFVRYSSSLALDTAQNLYGCSLNFLRWIADHEKGLPRFTRTLHSDYTKASVEDWEDVLALWQDDLISNVKLSEIRRSNIIRGVNTLLKKLRGFGVIPDVTFVPPPSALRKANRPTRTLAELPRPDITDKANRILEEALLGETGTDTDLRIKRDFITTLISETGKIDGTAEEQAKALMQINAERLADIRACASEDFKKWRDHWFEGQRLIRSCDMTFAEIDTVINQSKSDTISKSNATVELFPAANHEVSLSRLLTYFSNHPQYRGRMRMQPIGTLDHWFWTLTKRFGVVDSLQAYLFPHPEMTMATAVIILCDTGANVSVVRTLLYDCLSNSKERGYKVFKGTKMRSRGKPIVEELLVKDTLHEVSCVEAIQTYQLASEPIRNLAKKAVARQLFLRIGKSGIVTNFDNQRWGHWFQVFRDRHPKLRNLRIQSKMIRPSVLLQASYDKETGIIAAATVGDHARMYTTFRYVSRFPNHILWAHKIRTFQSLFQAVSIQSIEGAAQSMGLSTEEVEKFFQEACRTGLGVGCLDSKAGVQLESKRGEVCTQIQNCPMCPNSFVLATVENFKDLIFWNYHLEQSRAEWEAHRPERWETVWLPWLVFTQVVIEQASRGRTVREFKAAKTLAEALIAQGQINLPPLW